MNNADFAILVMNLAKPRRFEFGSLFWTIVLLARPCGAENTWGATWFLLLGKKRGLAQSAVPSARVPAIPFGQWLSAQT